MTQQDRRDERDLPSRVRHDIAPGALPASVQRPSFVVLAAVALVALLLAAVPTRATAATAVPTRTAQEISIAKSVLGLLNAERALYGLPALTSDPHLQLSARRHDVAMARANTMSHQLPGEAYFSDRISQAGYTWSWAGENIAYNENMSLAGVLALQKAMFGERPPSDGHRRNILSRNFRNVGVDVLMDSAHHRAWLTTDFGRR